MSFVVVAPEVLAAAASDLAGIGSTLAQANAAALRRPPRCWPRVLMRFPRQSRRCLGRMVRRIRR